jgi:hypothetical protein
LNEPIKSRRWKVPYREIGFQTIEFAIPVTGDEALFAFQDDMYTVIDEEPISREYSNEAFDLIVLKGCC